jgi:hypothetical protein
MTTLLTFDQQKSLVAQKLATESINGNLITFKYARKVMFEYLWKTNTDLLECRGHTYDLNTKELVVAAPRKSFNYLEDGYWKDVPLDTQVVAYKKFNGFLACVSFHQDEMIYSTTGSTKSDFVGYAKEMIDSEHVEFLKKMGDYTAMFEIIHPDDPHIVAEQQGARFLGLRSKSSGIFLACIDHKDRVDGYYTGTLQEILDIADTNQGEGFMVYLESDEAFSNCCKIKTPYYVGKKKLIRMKLNAIKSMFNAPDKTKDILPEYWKFAVDNILTNYSVESWNETKEQMKREILESWDDVRIKTM